MIATDDRAMRFLDKSALISQVYNWYKRVIIARHASAHTWLLRKNVQPTASNWGLRAYIAGKAARGIYHQLKPGGIPGTVMTGLEYLAGAPIGLGGFLMNRIGSGIGYLPPKLKSGVQTLGGGIVSTLRGIDYVTGEMENLVLPNLVNVGGWLKGGASALWNYKRK